MSSTSLQAEAIQDDGEVLLDTLVSTSNFGSSVDAAPTEDEASGQVTPVKMSPEEISAAVSDALVAPSTPPRDLPTEEVLDDSPPAPPYYRLDTVDAGELTPVASRTTIINDVEEEKGEVTTCPKWSDTLTSPSTDPFSPSRELHRPGSLHGMGLSVAVDRAKKLSKCGRRCATLLYDVAALYDSYAQSILKSCQSLSGGSAVVPPVVGLTTAVNRSLVSFAKQMQGLAICIRGSVARPLHGSMGSMGDTVPSIYNRYAKTRVKSVSARKNALQMRSKYVKAVREAEDAIREFQQARNDDQTEEGDKTMKHSQSEGSMGISVLSSNAGGETPLDSISKGLEKSLKKFGQKTGVSAVELTRLLKQVQSYEAEYCALVDSENHAVSQSQTMEVMALEAVQKLEEERLQSFVETLKRTLQAEKGALDNMLLSLKEEQSEASDAVSKEKKGNVFTSLLKPSQSQYDEGIGIMEAETLGLPEEVGLLRDDVRSRLAARSTRLHAAKALVGFLEEVTIASAALANGLKMRLGQDGYGHRQNRKNKTADALAVALEKNEGPRILNLWNSLVDTMEDSGEAALNLAGALKKVREEKLDSFVLRADRELKVTTESDDMRWKHLCDAARSVSKAENRYRQTTAQFEKARERKRSVDGKSTSDHGSGTATPSKQTPSKKMPQGVSKALGNVFSILPNGGEHAMKMMTPDARRAIAQTSFEEADQKEAKDKQSLDAARAALSEALKFYTAPAQNMIAAFKEGDERGWDLVRFALESSVSAFDGFRQNRYKHLNRPANTVSENDDSVIIKDMAEWTERARLHIAKKAEQNEQKDMSPGHGTELGFCLRLQLERSSSVHKLFALVESDGKEPDVQDDPEKEARTREESSIIAENQQPEKSVPTLRKRCLTDPSLEDMSSSTRELISLAETLKEHVEVKKNEQANVKSGAEKPDTEVFRAHFWSDRDDGETPPTVIASFSCAYWPKEGEGFMPLLHGRLFVTAKTMYFVGWGGKKIVLDWNEVVSVVKEKDMCAVDNALRVTYNGDSGESSYFFGSFAFRENAFQLMNRLSEISRSLNEIMDPSAEVKDTLPAVQPDEVLKKMDVMLTKKIKNISVQRFYEIVWSEGNRTDADPFYGPWLENMGSHKVQVDDWNFSDDGFVNQWCDEKYGQKREVNFEFTRTTHLYVGPPVAGVKQTQHCRVEGQDKCVMAMTVLMSGIPYADCFTVELRWVARRIGSKDIQIEVGAFVDFKKSTMFANKIRSGTVTETKPVHAKLFEAARKACAEAAGEPVAEEDIEEQEEEGGEVVIEKNPFSFYLQSVTSRVVAMLQNPMDEKLTVVAVVIACWLLLRVIYSSVGFRASRPTSFGEFEHLEQRLDDLQAEMKEMQRTLKEVLSVMKESSDRNR